MTVKKFMPECLDMCDTLMIHQDYHKTWRYMDSYRLVWLPRIWCSFICFVTGKDLMLQKQPLWCMSTGLITRLALKCKSRHSSLRMPNPSKYRSSSWPRRSQTVHHPLIYFHCPYLHIQTILHCKSMIFSSNKPSVSISKMKIFYNFNICKTSYHTIQLYFSRVYYTYVQLWGHSAVAKIEIWFSQVPENVVGTVVGWIRWSCCSLEQWKK